MASGVGGAFLIEISSRVLLESQQQLPSGLMAPRDLPGTRRALDTASSTRAPTTSHAPPPAPVSDLFVDPMMGCPLAMYVDKDVPDQAEIQRLIVVRAPPCLRGAGFSLTARRNTAGTCPSGTVRCPIYSVSRRVMRAGAGLTLGW